MKRHLFLLSVEAYIHTFWVKIGPFMNTLVLAKNAFYSLIFLVKIGPHEKTLILVKNARL